MRPLRRCLLGVFIIAMLGASACSTGGGSTHADTDSGTAESIILTSAGGSYGWSGSYGVKSILTDGNTILQVAKGPVRVISIRLIDSGSPARVLGIGIRKLHVNNRIPFDEAPGYPTDDPDNWNGTEPAVGADLAGPSAAETTPTADYELMIGYQLPSRGKYVRTGIDLTFSYNGHQYSERIASEADICVPRSATCDHGN